MDNIYIQHEQEIRDICNGKNPQGLKYDVGVGIDIFNQIHGLKHDVTLMAGFKKHLGLPLSLNERNALEALEASDKE